MIKIICDSVNHTRFPKEDQLPNCERRENKVTKGYRANGFTKHPAHPEGGDGFSHRNVGKPSHFDAADCPGKFS